MLGTLFLCPAHPTESPYVYLWNHKFFKCMYSINIIATLYVNAKFRLYAQTIVMSSDCQENGKLIIDYDNIPIHLAAT